MKGEFLDALNDALIFEEKGHTIYEKASKTATNPLVKKTFEYLADQEIYHISEIKNYIAKKSFDLVLQGDNADNTNRFFAMTVKEFKDKVDLATENDIAAYKIALGLERESYDFYKGQFELTGDDKAKAFFKFLMEQENAHYELIRKALQYLQDPFNFYAREENWNFEGG